MKNFFIEIKGLKRICAIVFSLMLFSSFCSAYSGFRVTFASNFKTDKTGVVEVFIKKGINCENAGNDVDTFEKLKCTNTGGLLKTVPPSGKAEIWCVLDSSPFEVNAPNCVGIKWCDQEATYYYSPNKPPEAIIKISCNGAENNGDTCIITEGQKAKLSSESSKDPDGGIVKYAWSISSIGTINTEVLWFYTDDKDAGSFSKEPGIASKLNPGTYTATLTVTDDKDSSTTSKPATIIVKPKATDTCQDTETRVSYDQESPDGCDNVMDNSCVGLNDDSKDIACCQGKIFCAFKGECLGNLKILDLHGDGIAGEYCSQNFQWLDCDTDKVQCKAICGMEWTIGGEDAPFGEYNTGTSVECCGDDPGEFYVTNGPGASRCCAEGKTYVDAAGECLTKKPNFSILFLPVDYGPNVDKASFDAERDRYLKGLLDYFPLKECPDLVHVNTIYTDCPVGISTDFDICTQKSISYLTQIKACGDASGKSHNYIMGLEAKDVCKNTESIVRGWGSPDEKTLWIKIGEDPIILAHEFGHVAAGLNDEYFDAVRCNIFVINPKTNNLDINLKGSDPYGSKYSDFCATEGGGCPSDPEVTCMGNNPRISGGYMKDSTGGFSRCVMSFANQPKTRAFCPLCMEQIKKVPELNCGT